VKCVDLVRDHDSASEKGRMSFLNSIGSGGILQVPKGGKMYTVQQTDHEHYLVALEG